VTPAQTKYLMSFSALVMFALGVLLTFAPGEVIHAAGGAQAPLLTALAQACGALYLGFAILNWMARDNLIGGIYSRPVSLGNFLHFFMIALALVKSFSILPRSVGVIALTGLFCILAAGFGIVLFRHPTSK
jgi:hypothetical protein